MLILLIPALCRGQQLHSRKPRALRLPRDTDMHTTDVAIIAIQAQLPTE
jgi:hypothetical protein